MNNIWCKIQQWFIDKRLKGSVTGGGGGGPKTFSNQSNQQSYSFGFWKKYCEGSVGLIKEFIGLHLAPAPEFSHLRSIGKLNTFNINITMLFSSAHRVWMLAIMHNSPRKPVPNMPVSQ